LSDHHPDKVLIKGRHISWESQDGQLLLFRNPTISGKKILVVSPHPDDAEIAAFGFYSNRDSYVVTITDGSAGAARYSKYFPGQDKAASYQLKAKLRVIDSITVPMIGGISPVRCYNLGYFDGSLEAMHNSPERENTSKYTKTSDVTRSRKINVAALSDSGAKATWNSLVTDLSILLKKINPDIIVTPHPILDSNRDHEYSSLAVLEALERVKPEKKGQIFLYSNHYVHTNRYPFGRRGATTSLPPLFSHPKRLKSVYSYSLTTQQQVEKVFALDAMHDLRELPLEGDMTLADMWNDILHDILHYIRNDSDFDLSYYRKGIHANELFMVHPFSDAANLIAEYDEYRKTG
jgi:LmbE family N-acetylglucosaminyl deacetylase